MNRATAKELRVFVLYLLSVLALSLSAWPGECLSQTDPLSGFGTATLDGLRSPGEWDKAGRVDFLVNTSSGKAPATLIVMNDWSNLYLAIRIERPLGTNSYGFEIDNNHNGITDEGDDAFVVNAHGSGPSDFFDDFRTYLPPCPLGSLCGLLDTDFGGTNDGSAVTRSDGRATFTEISKPLDSGDHAHDFRAGPGQVLGLQVSVRLFDSGMADSYFPGYGYLDFAIAAGPKQGMHTLTVQKTGDGRGTVTSAPAGIECGQVCAWPYDVNTAVTLTATPESGYVFAGWSGDRCAGTGPCVLSMSDDITVRAEFSQTKASPVVDQEQPVINLDAGVVLAIGSNSDQMLAQVVTAGITGDLAEIRLAVACAEEIALTVRIEGVSGDKPNGAILSSGRFTSVGPYKSPPVFKGFQLATPVFLREGERFAIVLEATPNSMSFCSTYPGPEGNPYPGGDAFYGSRLDSPVQWVRMLHSPGTRAGVDLPFQTVVRPLVHRLTVEKPLNGAVTGKGITCPGECSSLYYPAEEVTLNAVADPGFVLNTWSGCDSVQGNQCIVSMSGTRTVTAMFIQLPPKYSLNVRKAGTGKGTVRSVTEGISCGTECGSLYDPGTTVTLDAVPDPGYAFTGWSGGGCSGTENCTVTLWENTVVNANFECILPMPTKQEAFVYEAVIAPEMVCGAPELGPLGVGPVAKGKPFLNLTVAVPLFSGAVDYYLAFHASDIDPDRVYLMNEDGGIEPHGRKLVPWKVDVKDVVYASPLAQQGNLLGGKVPPGEYRLGLLVMPAGGDETGPYYLWVTSFEVR